MQPAPAAPTTNPFNTPAPVGGVRPRIADLRNRMVAIIPTRLELNVPGVKPGETQDRITADVVVFDGGPLEFGGKPEKYIPHTLVISTPCEFAGIYISQVNLVNALRGSVNNGVVLGRITQGVPKNPQHNPPWNLDAVEPTSPEYRMAIDYWSARALGQIPRPEAQPIPGAPAPTLAYTHATTMPHNAQGQPVANPAVVGAYATAQPAAPAYPQATQPAQPAPTPQGPPGTDIHHMLPPTPIQPQAIAVPPMPPGVSMPPDVWASLNDQQRAQIAASVGAMPPPAAPVNPAANPY